MVTSLPPEDRTVSRTETWFERLQSTSNPLTSIGISLAVAAGVSLLGMFGDTVGPDTISWLVRFGVIGVLIFAPLVALVIWLGRRLHQPLAPLLGCLLLLAVVGLSLRGSLLLGATTVERPGELLRAGNTAPAARLMVERLERLSRDETTFQANATDPTGGHGLSITLDAAVTQPFAWYLRDFPNVRIASAGDPATATQVIITSPSLAATPTNWFCHRSMPTRRLATCCGRSSGRPRSAALLGSSSTGKRPSSGNLSMSYWRSMRDSVRSCLARQPGARGIRRVPAKAGNRDLTDSANRQWSHTDRQGQTAWAGKHPRRLGGRALWPPGVPTSRWPPRPVHYRP